MREPDHFIKHGFTEVCNISGLYRKMNKNTQEGFLIVLGREI